MKALISVSDKRYVEKLAKELLKMGYEIYATDGTSDYLERYGLNVKRISHITGLRGGDLKTLHTEVFRMILSKKFSLIVVNLYEDKVDVGGVALIRAGIKAGIPVVCYPEDYDRVVDDLKMGRDLSWTTIKAVVHLLSNDLELLKRKLYISRDNARCNEKG